MATTYTQEEWIALTSLLLDDFSVRLRKEFELGRITGTDYATAYISNVNAATSQAQAFLLAKDTAGANADIAREQANQATITTEIMTATKQDAIDTSAEQLEQLTVQGQIQDEQLVQALVQGNILDQQEIQAIHQTTILDNNAEVSTATKQDNIDLAAAQTDIAEEQVNTQVNQTDSVLAQTEVMRERGGFR